MGPVPQIIEDFSKTLAANDVDSAVALYSEDASIVRFDGVSTGRPEIGTYLSELLSRHERFDLLSVDQSETSNDTVIWDANFDTGGGIIQMAHVFGLDAEGRIERHVPITRGYWGR